MIRNLSRSASASAALVALGLALGSSMEAHAGAPQQAAPAGQQEIGQQTANVAGPSLSDLTNEKNLLSDLRATVSELLAPGHGLEPGDATSQALLALQADIYALYQLVEQVAYAYNTDAYPSIHAQACEAATRLESDAIAWQEVARSASNASIPPEDFEKVVGEAREILSDLDCPIAGKTFP